MSGFCTLCWKLRLQQDLYPVVGCVISFYVVSTGFESLHGNWLSW